MPPLKYSLPQYNRASQYSMVPAQYISDTSDPIGRGVDRGLHAFRQGLGMIMSDKNNRAALQLQAQKDARDYLLRKSKFQLDVWNATQGTQLIPGSDGGSSALINGSGIGGLLPNYNLDQEITPSTSNGMPPASNVMPPVSPTETNATIGHQPGQEIDTAVPDLATYRYNNLQKYMNEAWGGDVEGDLGYSPPISHRQSVVEPQFNGGTNGAPRTAGDAGIIPPQFGGGTWNPFNEAFDKWKAPPPEVAQRTAGDAGIVDPQFGGGTFDPSISHRQGVAEPQFGGDTWDPFNENVNKWKEDSQRGAGDAGIVDPQFGGGTFDPSISPPERTAGDAGLLDPQFQGIDAYQVNWDTIKTKTRGLLTRDTSPKKVGEKVLWFDDKGNSYITDFSSGSLKVKAIERTETAEQLGHEIGAQIPDRQTGIASGGATGSWEEPVDQTMNQPVATKTGSGEQPVATKTGSREQPVAQVMSETASTTRQKTAWTQQTGHITQGEGGLWFTADGKAYRVGPGPNGIKNYLYPVKTVIRDGYKYVGTKMMGGVLGSAMTERFAENVAKDFDAYTRRRPGGINLSKEAVHLSLLQNMFSEASRFASEITSANWEAMVQDALRAYRGRKDIDIDEIDAGKTDALRKLYPQNRKQGQQMNKAFNDVMDDVNSQVNDGKPLRHNINTDKAYKAINDISKKHGVDVQDVLTIYSLAATVRGNESQWTWWGDEFDADALSRKFDDEKRGAIPDRNLGVRDAFKTTSEWIGMGNWMGSDSQQARRLFQYNPTPDPNAPPKYQGTGKF